MKKRLVSIGAVGVIVFGAVAIAGASGLDFRADDLSGAAEVPARVTGAEGKARFVVSDDGQSIEFRLKVDDLSNTWMAHLHMAPAGSNGPIVVWLFPRQAPPPPAALPGVTDGTLARGTITAADLAGPLAGQPLSALVDAINAGIVYVNVHTNDFVDPPNTGPGDFPGGELREQLHNHHDS